MISRGHRSQRLLFACIGSSKCNNARENIARPMRMFHSQTTASFYPCGNRTNRRPPLISISSDRMPRFSTITTTTKSAYTHPLSQIVLEHLQSRHSLWVQQMGLDKGLALNKDGTFVLRFPRPDGANATAEDEAAVEESSSESEDTTNINGSIWTMYEPTEKMHYLCVSKGSLVGRYMLQDNTKPAWHSDKKSTPERVQDAVDEMIDKIREVGSTVSGI